MNKRIAVNTLVMYATLMCTIVLGLLTSRLVLLNMGVEDFGIYSLLVGFVFAFAFINGAVSTSIQRFISIALSSNETSRASELFKAALLLNIILALLLFLLFKTFGFWIMKEYLLIPEARVQASNWVFNAVIISCVCQILATPAQAVLNANERMVSVALINFIAPFSRFLAAISIPLFQFDGLLYFSAFVSVFSVLQLIALYAYSSKVCTEISFSIRVEGERFKELGVYAAWDLLGNLAGVFKVQGPPIVMNMFFGVMANAAAGIVHQVTANLATFANQATQASTPQIVRAYNESDRDRSLTLVAFMSNLGFFILFTFAMPFLFKTEYLLTLWLVEPPQYSVELVRIGLLAVLIEVATRPIVTLAHAAGNIKQFHTCTNLVIFLMIPTMYFLYFKGESLETGFLSIIVFSIINSSLQVFFLKNFLGVSLKWYFSSVTGKQLLFVLINVPAIMVAINFLSPLFGIALLLLSSSLSSVIFLFGVDAVCRKMLLILFARTTQ
jgi:O-antigen/teichoic acid export membrane protein